METTVHELKITLEDVIPPVWRTVSVPSDITLADLHRVIQLVMGWEDYHLHQFNIKGVSYEILAPGQDQEPDIEDASLATLGELVTQQGESFVYEYDFGDSWTHRITVLNIVQPSAEITRPRCTGGERACPPEDCGGPFAFMVLLDAIADPSSGDYDEETLESLPPGYDPDAFDLPMINRRLNSLRLRTSRGKTGRLGESR